MQDERRNDMRIRQVALLLGTSVACLLLVAAIANRTNRPHAQLTVVTRWSAPTERQLLTSLSKASPPTADALLALARNDLDTPLTITIGGSLEDNTPVRNACGHYACTLRSQRHWLVRMQLTPKSLRLTTHRCSCLM